MPQKAVPKGDAAKRKSRKTKRDDPEQSKRFIDAAREHDADETGEQFERQLKRIVPTPSDG